MRVTEINLEWVKLESHVAFNRMSEAERMKQLFEMLMMNNPKNLMGLQHSDLNSFTRDIVMKIQNPVLSDKIAKIAMESERVALIPQKKVPTNQYDVSKICYAIQD